MTSNRWTEYGSIRRISCMILAISALALAAGGCGGSSSSYTPSSKTALSGDVFGGAAGNPIAGAQVALYQSGASGYGASAQQLKTARSDKNGHFKFSKFQCQAGQQLYLVATGGTPAGQSAANAAIALSVAIGPCEKFAGSAVINEVTTAATVWALNQFTDSTGQNIGTSASNQIGLSNAAAIVTASTLVDVTKGLTPEVLPLGIAPTSDGLYTIADILATCVDSSGPDSSECQALFTAAAPPTGPAPATTLEAAVDMARNPANNVATLYDLIPDNPPFTPLLTAAPSAWALAIQYDPADTEYNFPYEVAVDAGGNVWTVNAGGNSVSMLSATAGYTTGSVFGPSSAGLDGPTGISIDLAGNAWAANYNGSSVSELTASSNYATGLNFAPAAANFGGPLGIVLDASGNVWTANYNNDSVSELTASSNYATGLNFAPAAANFGGPASILVDALGNLWVTNYSGDSVSELTASSSYATGLNFAPAGAAFSNPVAIAFDSSGNAWVANKTGASVSELIAPAYTTGASFAPSGAALSQPLALDFDSANNLWVANDAGNNLSELTAASGYTTGLSFAPFAQIQGQFSLALDASGNVWVANSDLNTVSQFIGLANPVLTPAQACFAEGKDVCAP